MIVYHGSNSNFKHLRIRESLRKYESTKNNEGCGIYFSTDKAVAESYGKYIYTLEINDKYFVDFRNRTKCRLYVANIAKRIYKQTSIDILNYFNMQSLTDYMYFGGISITRVGHEIYMLLDSNEAWYKLPQSKIDKVYQMLRGADKKPPKAFMFNYHIKNIGVIKDVSDDVVRIIDKKAVY